MKPRTHLGLACVLALLAAPAAAGQSAASCTLTFDATWSAATHPTAFPPDPHFSGLIGGTHDALSHFWQVGDLATPGIELMAETGAKNLLQEEVEDAILAGFAGQVISGGGIGQSPGAVSVGFDVDLDFPHITVVSMIAPSPDWFVGVDGLLLFENGQWATEKVVDLAAYDAGTDSGASYTSPNQNTVPPEPIFEIVDPPFAGGTPLGTFTVRCSSALLFADGFEGGGLGSWSSSVP